MQAERRAHAELGPSAAPRWTRCAGAPNAERGLPDKPSIYAATGTLYHEIISECLQFGIEPDQVLGKKFTVDGYDLTFDETFAGPMRHAVDRVLELAEGGRLYVETKVDISPFTLPGQFGTTDVGIIREKEREIIIWDHKFGEGIAVSPVENEQCELYALGFWNDIAQFYLGPFDPAEIKVRIIIDQPRARVHDPDEEKTPEEIEEEELIGEDPDEPAGGGEWVTTMAHLLKRGEWYRERAKATLDPDAPRTPGVKQCQFCRARVVCKDRAKWFLDLTRMNFDDLDDFIDLGAKMNKVNVDPRSLTPEQRIFIAEHADVFKTWLRDVHQSVLDDYLRGYETPGVKAIRGRKGPRRWRDPAEVQGPLTKSLGDQAFEKKLVTPTKAQELLSSDDWEKISELITQSDGRPKLVHVTDPREAIVPTRDRFENLDATQE